MHLLCLCFAFTLPLVCLCFAFTLPLPYLYFAFTFSLLCLYLTCTVRNLRKELSKASISVPSAERFLYVRSWHASQAWKFSYVRSPSFFLRSSGEQLRPGSFFMCVPCMPARSFSYVPREPPKAVGQRRKGVKSQRNQANPAIRCFPQPPFWRPLASPQRPGSSFPTFLGSPA